MRRQGVLGEVGREKVIERMGRGEVVLRNRIWTYLDAEKKKRRGPAGEGRKEGYGGLSLSRNVLSTRSARERLRGRWERVKVEGY